MLLQILNPCPENWAEMTPETQGRFCQSCQKTVIDFTQMSDNQVVLYFKEHSTENACGRFYPFQLNRPLIENITLKRRNRHAAWKYMIWSVLSVGTLASPRMAYSQDDSTEAPIEQAQPVLSDTTLINSNFRLMGKVICGQSLKIIPNATIYVGENEVFITANKTGDFEIIFSENSINENITLHISAVGYKTVVKTLTLQAANKPIRIKMKMIREVYPTYTYPFMQGNILQR